MFERGIFKSGAHFWIHFWPIEYMAYWYAVRHMREYLLAKKIAGRIGHSKDGTETGLGFPVNKELPFIHKIKVEKKFVHHFKRNWELPDTSGWEKTEMTDNEAGQNGETVIDWILIGTGLCLKMSWIAEPIRSQTRQYELGDLELSFVRPVIEIKTERFRLADGSVSPNLYVQTHESGHKVHMLTGPDGKPVMKYTPVKPFSGK